MASASGVIRPIATLELPVRKIRTIHERRTLFSKVSTTSKVWAEMTPEQLLSEVQKVIPAIESGTPSECLRLLILDALDPIVGD